MTTKPADTLNLPEFYFQGGAHLDEANEAGLRAHLQGLAGRVSTSSVEGAAYTVLATDAGLILEAYADSATQTFTLPADIPVGFIAQIRQVEPGTVELTAGAGASIDVVASASSPIQLSEQWATCTIEVRDVDTWIVTGQLA
jgi:hypothetical protein